MIKSRFFLKNDPVFLREFDERLNLQRCAIEKHLFVPPIITLKVNLSSIGERIFFSNSYVRNFYNWLVSQCAGAPSGLTGKSYGDESLVNKSYLGTSRSHTSIFFHCYTLSGFIGAEGYMIGICVGNGTSEDNFNSYDLVSIINTGTGANELVYNDPSNPTYTWDPETRLFTLHHERSFYNGGSAAVNVTEAGIRITLYYTGSYYDTFLILRDLLPQSVSVPSGETLSLTYNFSITYPS